ncbi:MAG TPA: hypothetical protein VFC98_00740 [Clostridia bacterium]|nr:hypothetical protein [Clostridia bacterium]
MKGKEGGTKLTRVEAEKIIENYKPHKGFFNLGTKPDTLGNIEYAKILRMQTFLTKQRKHQGYLKEFDPTQWAMLKEMFGMLQGIILAHWGDAVFY